MDNLTQSTAEIIQHLKNSFSDCDQLRKIVKELLISLEKEQDDELLPEAISLLLRSTAQALPFNELDSSLLEPFLPLMKNFLFQKLNENHKIIDDASFFQVDSVVPAVLRNIEVCIQILADMDGLLAYLISLDRLPASDFCSAPKNIAEVVYFVFSHCQQSKAEYKDAFANVRSDLMSLFQQCFQVQVKLYTLLNEKLVFNCAFEEEVQMLIDITDVLHSMSAVVAELDTMSLVAHWKGFAQLTQTYAVHLRSRLDVARPITYLAANIAHQLGNLKVYLNAEKRVVLRALKISSLQLKVIIKLCEHYRDYLGDCHKPLLNCLVALLARTPQSLAQEGLTPEIAAQFTTQLTAGAAPLLSLLLTDAAFVKNFLSHGDELQSSSVVDKFGYCNVTNMVLKKLIHQSIVDDEIRELWLKPELPLMETVYKILFHCSDVFFAHEDDTYQSLLSHTAAFVITTTQAAGFPTLERLLIKQLLQPSLWPAIFTSDLLCLIARVGSSKLCLQLVALLAELCSGWPAWDRCRPEWSYVSWTLSRLTNFLAAEDLKKFPSRLPAPATVCSNITTLLGKPCSEESIQLYESLLERMTILKDHLHLFPEAAVPLVQPIYQLWQHMTLPVDVGFTETSHWFSTLFTVVVSISSHIVDWLDNVQIGNILDVFMKVCSSASTVFKCDACTFLRSLAKKCLLSDSDKAAVISRVASLFVQLMLDKNPLVKQIAFETFSYFAYVTKYEEIVASIVAKDCKLQVEITKYLEGDPVVQSDTDLLQHIANISSSFVHKCKQNKLNVNGREDHDLNPCKKLKTLPDESISDALLRIEKDLSVIEEAKKVSKITSNQISVLKCIEKRIHDIVEAP